MEAWAKDCEAEAGSRRSGLRRRSRCRLVAPTIAYEPAPSKTAASCDHPCTHVEDCPKATCECSGGTASGVAACDSDETHCCTSPDTACERFCEANHQKWTGRFTPESSPAQATSGDSTASAPAASCADPCKSPKDCRTVTCECRHGQAEDVAACDMKTNCCGSPNVVCEHFCSGKKGKWTGKLAEPPPPHDAPSLLDDDADETDDATDSL